MNQIRTWIFVAAAVVSAGLLTGCGDSLAVQSEFLHQPTQDTIKRVAIVDFAGERGQAVADMLAMHLQRAGYEIVERQNLEDMIGGAIDPLKEGRTDATLVERMSKVGKLINADAVITGDLVKLSPPRYQRASEDRLKYEGALCELSARAFDVRTREVFWTGIVNVTASAKNGEQLRILDNVNEATAELARSFADPHYEPGMRIYRGDEIAQRRGERHAFYRNHKP